MRIKKWPLRSTRRCTRLTVTRQRKHVGPQPARSRRPRRSQTINEPSAAKASPSCYRPHQDLDQNEDQEVLLPIRQYCVGLQIGRDGQQRRDGATVATSGSQRVGRRRRSLDTAPGVSDRPRRFVVGDAPPGHRQPARPSDGRLRKGDSRGANSPVGIAAEKSVPGVTSSVS